MISETWKIESVSNFFLPHFNIFYNGSQYNQNDGLVIYVRDTIMATFMTIHISETKLIRCNFEINKTTFCITAVYRPPSTNVKLFLNEFESYLKENKNNSISEMFVGDININILDKLDVDVNNYLNILSQHGFYSPTRQNEISSTAIDHIFVKKVNCLKTKQ